MWHTDLNLGHSSLARHLTVTVRVLLALGCVLGWQAAWASDPLARLPAEVADLATSDDAEKLTEWAERFEHGEGVPRDVDIAVTLYCMAAQLDSAQAEYGLGWLYANGRGVTRSDERAAAWIARAARRGDRHAKRLLPRLSSAPDDTAALCVLSDGTEALSALRSVPNPSRAQVIDWVTRLAPPAGIDPTLVLAVIQVESAFNARAKSHKNAQGLMQLIPGTARRFGVDNVWDPLANIRGGVAYLTWLLAHFKGDVRLALAGYNAGEHAVTRYQGIPPYAETRAYVRSVLRLCRAVHEGRRRFDRRRPAVKSAPAAATVSTTRKLHSCVPDAASS